MAQDTGIVENGSHLFQSMENAFQFLSESPPAGLLWITVIAAIATFAWRVLVFAVDRLDKQGERRRSIEDNYWFRNVVAPFCVEPLVEFVEEKTSKFRALEQESANDNADLYRSALTEFQKQKESTLARFLVLSSGESTYDAIASHLDKIDDYVTQHCALKSLGCASGEKLYEQFSSVEQAIYRQLREVIEELKKIHRNIG